MIESRLVRRIEAAQGKRECDLTVKNVRYLDVFSGRWLTGELSILDGVLVGVEPGLKAKRVIDGGGRSVVPGFIDAHVHVESSLLAPPSFQEAVLPCGTTTAICDPHELANVMGVEAIRYFLAAADSLKLDLRVMLSSCVPATHLETNGAGTITAAMLHSLASHPKALGLAEMMNFPGVLGCAPEVLEKIEMFRTSAVDGHCPLLTGHALSAYAAAGISSCHESTQLDEAREKLAKGIAVWIREGSVAKNLHALAPLITPMTSACVGLCTDDRNPLDIAEEGHLDYMIRTAISLGCEPEAVYRSASWSTARHYGLRGKGAIAPGYEADLVLLDDVRTCAVHSVLKGGCWVDELQHHAGAPVPVHNTIVAKMPEPSDLEGPKGNVHIIEVQEGQILTGRSVGAHDTPGIARLSVLERYGHGSKPANGYVRGFGEKFRGAIASSVGHDSHNLCVVGSNTGDMKAALAALAQSGGGFCVVRDGAVKALLPLPFGGLMSDAPPAEVERSLRDLHRASKDCGCTLKEPFLQLAFLSLPVIPSLKLTDKGLVDVDQFKIIPVSA